MILANEVYCAFGKFEEVAVKVDDLHTYGKIIEFLVRFAVHFKAADARVSPASNRTIPKVSKVVNGAVRVDNEVRADFALFISEDFECSLEGAGGVVDD